MRIQIVDDHSLVRSGFRLLLERIDGFEVVAEADNGATALQLITSEQPDLLITDIAMPEMSGLDLVSQARQVKPDLKCIVLSMHRAAAYVKSAMAVGASGYLLKDSVDSELELAIRTVFAGRTYISPAVLNTESPGGGQTEAGRLGLLTGRQIEVLRLIAYGRNTKEIAVELNVSPKTVETHRVHLMKRLEIFDVAGLVRFAIRTGLVELDEK